MPVAGGETGIRIVGIGSHTQRTGECLGSSSRKMGCENPGASEAPEVAAEVGMARFARKEM